MASDMRGRIEALESTLRGWRAAIATAPSAGLVESYTRILRDYLAIEAVLTRDRSPGARRALAELHEISPLDVLPDVSELLHTRLDGVRVVKLVVSQVFRIHDLLVATPDMIKSTKLLETIMSRSALRRALNTNASIELDGFGSLRSVQTTQFELRDFWSTGTQNLALRDDPPLCFVPFEVTPLPMLDGYRPDPESVIEQTLLNALGGARKLIPNVQTDARLRLYSPGVGVVRISITLTFADSANVEVLARIAREIESLLFVGPAEVEKDVDSFFDDAVRAVIAAIIADPAAQEAERRWRPPDTTFVLYDEGFDPLANRASLAHLVALSPGNLEPAERIEGRLARVLASQEWATNGMLAFAGHRSALLMSSRGGAPAVAKKRKKSVSMLLELQEVVASAAYVQRLFEEKLQEITAGGLLGPTWAPGTENFPYLLRLVRAMRNALLAVMSLKVQLEQYGAGVLVAFAKQLWLLRYVPPSIALPEQLRILSVWIDAQSGAEEELRELASLANQIGSFRLPFKAGSGIGGTAEEEDPESMLLDNLKELETMVSSGADADLGRVELLVGETMRIKSRLGIA
jgi:hypothetical protein